jgi:hypothetical protein
MADGAHPTSPPPESNALGLAGFIVSLVGLCAGGVLSPVGLILSLVALGRPPRGFAIAGTVLGLLGSCGIVVAVVLAILAPALLLGLAATAGVAGMLGPDFIAHVEMGRLNAHIAEYQSDIGALPMTLDDLTIDDDPEDVTDLLTDPWNNRYIYTLAPDGLSYTLHSMGPDAIDATSDDITVDPSFQVGFGVD